ncbi:hypothetical protein [Streptomyces sp. NPDC097610]|uniref:hypothetical protein n=1 Tax=Streptomyces sp. NPDC097610 TaxID=3157227 RepID=UPI00332A03DB
MLITAAWYQVLARTPIGFAFTPFARTALEDPGAFTFDRLLQLPHRDMVADVTAQLHKAVHGPLEALRARTRPEDSVGGPTFAGARITVVDGTLIDFKSARRPLAEMSQRTAWQLTGYLLLDAADTYQIDTVGLYPGSSPPGPSTTTSPCWAPAAATSPSCAACSANCSPDARARPTPGTPARKRGPSASGSSLSAWRRSPGLAAARCAPRRCPNPPAGLGSSAPHGAATGTRPSGAAD